MLSKELGFDLNLLANCSYTNLHQHTPISSSLLVAWLELSMDLLRHACKYKLIRPNDMIMLPTTYYIITHSKRPKINNQQHCTNS